MIDESMQTKDVPDHVMLDAIMATRGRHGVPQWSTLWDIEGHLPGLPKKVVRSKLRSLIKRRIIDGCTCGCRGDFEILEPLPAVPT